VSSGLQRLASALGIADSYEDIWGKRHATGDEVRRALCGAMGVEAGSDAAVQASLDALERERWRQSLPPMVVVREGAPVGLTLRLPAAAARRHFEVHVSLEQGGESSFTPDAVDPDDSPIVDLDGEPQVEVALRFAHSLPTGYHGLRVHAGDEVVAATVLAVAPVTCHRPASITDGRRSWGLALQLYGVRSAQNWGIGDFTDLATLVRDCGRRGIGVIGVNPLHALFPHNPRHISPYSPSSRLFLNVLYIDVTAVMDFAECSEAQARVAAPAFQRALEALRASERVDYAGAAGAKLDVLRLLHRHFRQHHLEPATERARAFADFVAAGGQRLRRHATFEALQEHLHADDASMWGWPAWPMQYRDPDSPAVERFAEEHAAAIEFYAYLQWQAHLQLRAVAGAARAARLSIGLYVDLSVSVDRGGAESWANQSLYAESVSIGAPPDGFTPLGQDWGLPPMIPARLRALGYAPFIETLRENMKHAGALRIDHVMGLMRLFWVPPGRPASEGTYVRYPFEDLLGLLALESRRNRCVVIGEDLGTVPDEVRTALAANDVLSYRVLLFERDADQQFKPAAEYPERSLVTASTHDLPTLAGWWEATDIEARFRSGLTLADEARQEQHAERALDRGRLLQAIDEPGTTHGPRTVPASLAPSLALSLQQFLARTPAALMVVQPEDVFGERDQANLPGTTEAHPNWQRKVRVPLEQWHDDARFVALADALRPVRGDLRHADASVPRATYRLQLHGGFTFAAATALVPYLAALGVSHLYCSPYLRARPGSLHGYDIVDHEALNPEIGTRADFERFVTVLRQHGMGHIADIVPNHMGVMGSDNAWWMDVLENGPSSRYAHFFDIDWDPLDRDLAGRVLLPVLGASYGEALESGELAVRFERDRGALAVWYHEHRFPLDPRTYPMLLDAVLRDEVRLPESARTRLAVLLQALRAIDERGGPPAAAEQRLLACERGKRELAAIAAAEPEVGAAIDRALQALSRGGAGSEPLHDVLEAQAFRLAYWRVAFDEINYRRFFDINELAALRMEHEPAFEATHRFVLGLAAAGMIDGLRIDHPDGLWDPARYFACVQASFAERAGIELDDANRRPVYLVVEKIIAPHEDLPEAWPVHGTTGYRYANTVNGVLVDTEARARIDRTWRAFAGDEAGDFETTAYRARRATLRGPLAAGLTVLANQALRLARSDRHTRDHTLASLRLALGEIAACFPVYRTYVSADGAGVQDRRYIDWAIARARRRSRITDVSVFAFLRGLLLADPAESGIPAEQCLAFAMRFQQFTAPVAAKGIEDTSFYRFNRLISLADVGGDPDQFGMTVRAFHGASGDRAAHWPATMLATSTHDNKRSEDARARIDVLSEVPAAWRLALRRWARFNRTRKRTVDGAPAPSRNDEVLLYQTLIGTWPVAGTARAGYRERIRSYMIKAVREAKVHTSWIAVNEEYEHAVAAFVDDILADGSSLFLDDLATQASFFAWFGRLNSVTLVILKLTSPGVPDIYQGNEVLDFSLVDPDNRRPVDYGLRRRLLGELAELSGQPSVQIAQRVPELFADMDGRAKLWVVMRLLAFRRAHAALLADGDYRAVAVRGLRARHIVAYARARGSEGVLVVAGRLWTGLGVGAGDLPVGEGAWGDTTLDLSALGALEFDDVLTGATGHAEGALRVADALASFPGAVLHFRRRSS
jgi:(1->4)-alpha-D-glucan 1-alpha-D-glucosylmutase